MSEDARSTGSPPGPAGRGAPRVISVGGGPGGAGKSLLTVNVGVYLAQLGRSVIIADVDPAGSGLHTMLGLDPPSRPMPDPADQTAEPRSDPIATAIPGLSLMPPVYDPGGALLRSGKKARWLSHVHELSADYLLLDLGGGISPATLDLFLASDVGLCVTVPEPPAIEATYRFLRALFLRQLRNTLAKDRYKLRLVERAIQGLHSLPAPIDIVAAIRRFDRVLADTAAAQLSELHPRLVVSQTRVRSDLDLGPTMRTLAWRFLGIDLDYVGYVEHDDAVWLTVRRRRPLLIDSPASKGARNVERIARRVLTLTAARETRAETSPPATLPDKLNLYEGLGVSRGASDEDVRRASKKQRETFAEGSLPITALVWGADLARERARIDEAHDTLLDPIRRRAYDLSTFPETASASQPPRRPTSEGHEGELLLLQAELAREIHSETQFTGALLQKVRESQGLEIADIAAKTKIALAHLRAIESESWNDLPALVYTRGFVQELAKCLRLDPAQVVRTYLKRMRDAMAHPAQPKRPSP